MTEREKLVEVIEDSMRGVYPCGHCKGSGSITNYGRVSMSGYYDEVECPHCDGKGKVVVEPIDERAPFERRINGEWLNVRPSRWR